MTIGSDLHIYRGHQPGPYGYVMVSSSLNRYRTRETRIDLPLTFKGHEFVGEVVEIGEKISVFKVGDRVVCYFPIHQPGSELDSIYIPGFSLHYIVRFLLLLRQGLDLSLYPISIIRLCYARRSSGRIYSRASSRYVPH